MLPYQIENNKTNMIFEMMDKSGNATFAGLFLMTLNVFNLIEEKITLRDCFIKW